MTASESPPTAATVRFTVRASAEPSVLPRVIELFALRNLVPSSLRARRGGRSAEDLHIDIEVAGLAAAEVRLVAAKITEMVPVESVLAGEGPRPVEMAFRRSA